MRISDWSSDVFPSDLTGIPVTLVDRNRSRGLSVFGQATMNSSDPMRLTVGGRYGVDNRVGEGPYFDASGVGSRYDFSGTYRRFDYKVGLEYEIAPRAMVSAALQTRFGIFSAQRRSTAPSRCARPVTVAL